MGVSKMIRTMLANILILGMLIFGLTGPIAAQETKDADSKAEPKKGHADLTTAATNPVGSIIQLQLQNLYIPESDNSSGHANTGIIQPVVPIHFSGDNYFQGIVTRTTIPIVTTPKVAGNRETGIGDITAIIAPTHTAPTHGHSQGKVKGDFVTWAPVAAVVLPTASKPELGADVWSAGPGFLGLTNIHFPSGDSVMLGALAYHIWNLENDDGDPTVNKSFAQPVIVYKFNSLFDQKGWYVRNPDDLWSYDWHQSEWDQITAGAALGRVFTIGKQPVNVFGGAWYNPVGSDRAATSKYALKLSFAFLFPVK
jgi:hypothetical protein